MRIFELYFMKVMDGKEVSNRILGDISEEIKRSGLRPRLALVRVGEDEASKVYLGLKERACEKVGIYTDNHMLPEETTQKELLKLIGELNCGEDHGILVQLPLPEHIDQDIIIHSIDPSKDVDGIHPENLGKLLSGKEGIVPCTPKGIIKLLEYYGIEISGKHVVVVGRSNIVGKPVAMLLMHRNATVTLCHSKTTDLKEHTSRADILVIAIGKPKTITADMVKENAVVIDVGISRVDGKLIGDVDFQNVRDKTSYITPVPGGVGPMTVAMLMKNTLSACKAGK